jgi:hypothetical protein
MEVQTLNKKIKLLPDEFKKEAEQFIDELLEKAINSKEKPIRDSGFLKGKIYISDDFDEPIDDFKEYSL